VVRLIDHDLIEAYTLKPGEKQTLNLKLGGG